MKPITLYIALTVTCISFVFGEDQRETTNEQEVRQMIQKYRSALLQRDIPMLEKIWADDYVFVNASGQVLTKAQRLANLKSGATTLESINEEEKPTVRVYQNSAVATSRVTLKGQYSRQPTSGQYRSTHEWAKASTR